MFFKESAIKPKEVKFSDKSLEKNIRKEFKPEIKKLSKLIKKDLRIWYD